MKTTSHATPRRDTDAFLRGLAICCVITIHFLSSLKISPYVTGATYQLFAVSIDQLGRVAVPLFVVLSGYGLMMKYQHSELRWKEFLQKRVWKLIPLYVLWSYIFWFVFLVIPQWRPTSEMKPFFGQLLFGNADYHLYFVPMIFQLYLLFPFLLPIVKKWPYQLLVIVGVFQVGFYELVAHQMTNQPGTSFFQSDQKQYVWFFCWIFYFILGMCLPKILSVFKAYSSARWIALAAWVLSGCWVAVSALYTINHGTDPLVALRFTRVQVMVYATCCTLALFLLLDKSRPLPKLLVFLGVNSYLIYLSHTLLLRIVFLFINPHP